MLTEKAISAVVITGLLRDYTIFRSHWGLMLLMPLRAIGMHSLNSY